MLTSPTLRPTTLLLASLCLALFACSDDGGDGTGQPPGQTGAPPAASGLLTPPSLEAETPFEVTHEAALLRRYLSWDLVPRRLTELRDFRNSGFMDLIEEVVGGEEGTADCGISGSVSRSLESRTLRDPFLSEDRAFSGMAVTFSNCVFGELREIALDTDRSFDGAMTVLEADDGTLFLEVDGPFRLNREGEALGMPYSDRRQSTMSWFEKPTGASAQAVSIVGTWTSSGTDQLGNVAAEAWQFDVLGFGGSGEAEALRRNVTAPGDGQQSDPATSRMRIQVDRRSTDSGVEDCVAPGRFDLDVVEEELERADGTVVARYRVETFTGAGGVTAVVQPFFELVNNIPIDNGVQVTIGDDVRVFTQNEAGALWRQVEDTCRPEFTGFGW
ncbi:MAG: hypothetical protein EA398_16925 [Deltaproteobacteria bacterium]|nr:MAG: hypothetical protein EA398_16925 [Deltaproteobacteria bacterium]